MRIIDTDALRVTVKHLCLEACVKLEPELLTLLYHARDTETSEFGRGIMCDICENARLAAEKHLPICQDTGMVVVFLEVGQAVCWAGEDINIAVNRGVAEGYKEGYFRASVLSPLTRINTRDNTPCVMYVDLVPGEQVKVTVAPKGFGSENMSRVAMLTPADGADGVRAFVIDTVRVAGANPCPPLIVGVGIGGTMDKAAYLAKRALNRPAGTPATDPEMATLERELLTQINALNIGPQGLGGINTALAVHVDSYPTHIAGLPVAVNLQCHVARHASAVI